MIMFWSNYWLMAEVATYESVAKLYVATFNRAPDADGLEYWVYKSNLPLEGIAKSFFEQVETKKLYPPSYSNSKFIDTIYKNLFNREPDNEGKKYWLKELERKNIDKSTFILAVVNGALGDDAILLKNKTEVALEFAQRGLNDYKLAKEVMRYVNANPESVEVAISKLDEYNSNYTKIGSDDKIDSNSNANNNEELNKKSCIEKGEDEYCIDDTSVADKIGTSKSYTPKKIGWYGRIVAKATLKDGREFIQYKEGVFGEYIDSIDGIDRHDIPSYGTDILRVVFIHPDLNDTTTYYSDYRQYIQNSDKKEVWTFQVKNDRDINLAKASLKIYIKGLYEIFDNRAKIEEKISKNQDIKRDLKIIDVDNHSLYLLDESNSINLSMDGKHTRTFRIIKGDVVDEDYKSIQSINNRVIFREKVNNLHKGFGLPPNI